MTGLGSSCGACKFLRRRCTSECVFAPYFCYDEAAAHFAAVHKVFGASNVSKILSYLPMHNRSEAAISISYEALARMQDPVYGCVAQIFVLQQQVASLQEEIEMLETQMALAVDVSSVGNSQAINNINNELQFSSQQDEANVGTYLSQQPPDFSHELISGTSANHAFCSQMNIQLPTIFELEDQTSIPYSNSSSIERLLGEMHQGIFTSCPWRNNGSNSN